MQRQYGLDRIQDLVIFGYGSLIWRPGFPYYQRTVGYIRGYERRFYQGNCVHRGTQDQPGRVATLIRSANPDSRVWGCAYEVKGEKDISHALSHLLDREVINGGYQLTTVLFYPTAETAPVMEAGCRATTPTAISTWVCVSNPAILSKPIERRLFSPGCLSGRGGTDYLGDAPMEEQASQIAVARGKCGPNTEYVFHLTSFMRTEVPSNDGIKDDPYLFELETMIIKILKRSDLDFPDPRK